MTEFQPFPVSVIIAGFCVMSAAYLICFCCCIIQFLLRRGRIPPNTSTLRTNLQRPNALNMYQESNPQKNDKLKEEFWKRFRNSMRRFKKQKQNPTEDTKACCIITCPICFDEYGDPAEVLIGYIKVCGHYFHFDCIWTWLENRPTCPICREKTHLKESDIKGIALRHVEEYQHACLAQIEKEKKCNMDDETRPGTSLEQGVEAVEVVQHNDSTVVNLDTEVYVNYAAIEKNQENSGHSIFWPASAAADDNSNEGHQATPGGSSENQDVERGSRSQAKAGDDNAHDNRAFVNGDELV